MQIPPTEPKVKMQINQKAGQSAPNKNSNKHTESRKRQTILALD